jgi:hypothetical protein
MFKPSDLKVVVNSRNRSDVILSKTLSVIPDADVVVLEQDFKDYSKVVAKDKLHVVPKEYSKSLATQRQFVLDTFSDKCIVFCDDDLVGVRCFVGERLRMIKEPEAIKAILYNTYIIASEIGTPLFYFNRGNNMFFAPTDPFKFCAGFVLAVLV